jgi:UDP-N-acetyl-D-galactosamine dehydrogenase
MAHNRKVSVIGLGYVGLPVAVAFSKQHKVIGFDKNSVRIDELKKYYDRNGEFTVDELKSTDIFPTSNPQDLHSADFHIVAVPTPIDAVKRPDLAMLSDASETIGKQLKKGDIVVYESTVYPGATEEVCVPLLEEHSGLICGKDFTVGYSPERINPGDKQHHFADVKKIVSGQDEKTLDIIAEVYGSFVSAGVYRVSSIKVAEAAKVIENTQRDLNISLINEITLILHKLHINTREVLDAAATKWNFLPFRPGLVGGHCIGVDPYYLTYKAEKVGYHPDVILAGRRINDLMGKFIAEQTVKKLIHLGVPIKGSRVLVMGITFKENCRDTRNSRVFDVIEELKLYGVEVFLHDPMVVSDVLNEGVKVHLTPWKEIPIVDAIVLAVSHQQYIDMNKKELKQKLNTHGLIMDVKSILDSKEFADTKITLWQL